MKSQKKQKAFSLWGKIIHQLFGQACAKCGTTAGRLEAHHIGGRDNASGLDIDLGILLCENCHKYAPDAPHRDKQAFLKWLQNNYPEKYERYLEKKNVIVFDRDIDIAAITREFKVIARGLGVCCG